MQSEAIVLDECTERSYIGARLAVSCQTSLVCDLTASRAIMRMASMWFCAKLDLKSQIAIPLRRW
jgi:hypothetical protein